MRSKIKALVTLCEVMVRKIHCVTNRFTHIATWPTPTPWEPLDSTNHVELLLQFSAKFVDSPKCCDGDLVPCRTISTWSSRVNSSGSLGWTDYDNRGVPQGYVLDPLLLVRIGLCLIAGHLIMICGFNRQRILGVSLLSYFYVEI